jgi:hypothetical protein
MATQESNIAIEKVFKKTSNEIKSLANTMISNGNMFCCAVVDNTITESETIIYPTNSMNIHFINNMFSKEFAPKQLPQKALDEMKKKGIEPKKQICDILLFVIIPTEYNIIVGINVPGNITFNIDDYILNTMMNCDNVNIISNSNSYHIITIEGFNNTPFKEADVIMRNTFIELKRMGLYKDEEEETIINEFDF